MPIPIAEPMPAINAANPAPIKANVIPLNSIAKPFLKL
jgi:hypothetical protein